MSSQLRELLETQYPMKMTEPSVPNYFSGLVSNEMARYTWSMSTISYGIQGLSPYGTWAAL